MSPPHADRLAYARRTVLDRLSLTHFKAFRHTDLPLRPLTLLTCLNPEAHLHPRGQTAMAVLAAAAAAAAAQGAQIVMETHSDHALGGMRLAVKREVVAPEQVTVHYFRGDGSGTEVVTPNIDKDGMLDQWPEGFFDELENTLDELLG